MIWLIGNRGMLGQDLANLLSGKNIPFIGTDLEIDITRPDLLAGFADKNTPDWIINCSAYTSVDKAEEEPEKAYLINSDGPANLAALAKKRNIRFVHMSSDYVFRGSSDIPLKESDPPDPASLYGKSKYEGEQRIIKTLESHFIIRTAWLYGKYGKNFVYTMLRLMNEKTAISVVNDQIGSPSWTGELSELICRIITDNSSDFGIYHYSGSGITSWFGFAEKIYESGRRAGLINSSCNIIPCTSDEYKAKARRPAYSLLDKTKIKKVFDFHPESWETTLDNFLRGIQYEDIR